MARPCTICAQPSLTEINRALVDSPKQFREVAFRFGVSYRALERHAANHLTGGLARAVVKHAELAAETSRLDARRTELIEETRDFDVLASLKRLTSKAEMMLAAADEWLRDPSDPARYNLNPRTHEIEVVYEETIGDRASRKTAKLSHLLERVEQKLHVTVIKGESRTADPRKLLLDAVDSLKPVLELLGKATGQIRPDPGITLNVFLESKEWQQVESTLVEALRPHPAALEAAGRALATIGGSDDAR